MARLARLLSHAGVLLLIAGLLAVAYPQLAGPALIAPTIEREATPAALSARAASLSSHAAVDSAALAPEDLDIVVLPQADDGLSLAGARSLLKVPQRETIIPKRPRKELLIHTAVTGDNLSTIAQTYDVDVDTLIWANAELEEDPDYLVVDQKLKIPPVSGVLYTVKTGDTLAALATKFKGELRTMLELEYNHLSDAATVPGSGTLVMIPGGEKEYQPRLVYIDGRAVMVNAPRGGGRFVWPAQGYITNFWGPDHRAIDIGAPEGTPIYAERTLIRGHIRVASCPIRVHRSPLRADPRPLQDRLDAIGHEHRQAQNHQHLQTAGVAVRLDKGDVV